MHVPISPTARWTIAQEQTMSGNNEPETAEPGHLPVPRTSRLPAVRQETAVAIAATAIGALALGAVAIGAISIGRLAIGRVALGRARLRSGQIDELRIARLTVAELRVERVLPKR
jgi:hypothetical protein